MFAINPPLALIVVALLRFMRRTTGSAARRFDFVGAAILAGRAGVTGLGVQPDRSAGGRAWQTLSWLQAPGCSASRRLPVTALWERASQHPMTPPRLLRNRAFVGLNVGDAADLYRPGGHVLPVVVRSRRPPPPDADAAGLAFLPFTLGVGFVASPSAGWPTRSAVRLMLIVGPLGAALAFTRLALGETAPLVPGVLLPMTLLGLSFAYW